ncbi:PilW family protein [Microbulbifer bruguierae]|uniref:PilW family protein n=1 Tax=Microbulbifer bruguierae TaxID=3029061 RepID=A0ABY8NGZ3_9GAMM|nr:PilW family protein [Microbulbifer bruguierae]WGL18188.1 PilW family protein [Microbulbifer bruguierae]
MKNFQQQRGISLVELMISITIGLILMTGVVQLFLSSRVTFSTQQALARVQESGRLAMDFLAKDIRMAGFAGCSSRHIDLTNQLNDQSLTSYKFNVAIEGEDDIGAEPPAGYPDEALEGTDILVVRSAGGSSLGIKKMNDADYVYARYTSDVAPCGENQTGSSGICSGDILMVANCRSAYVFQATEVLGDSVDEEVQIAHAAGDNPGNHVVTWGGSDDAASGASFGPDAQIFQMITTVYYIADGASGAPSLWQEVNGLAPQELLEGVQDMQLTYGVDSNGDGAPDNYVDAGELTGAIAWSDVVSARVELLVQSSEDNVLSEPQSYTFNGVEVDDPGDRRLRQVFSSTVAIRSRIY